MYEYQRQKKDLNFIAFERFIMAVREVHESKNLPNEALEKLHVKIATLGKKEILKEGKFIKDDPFSQMFLYKDRLFFMRKDMPPPPDKPFIDLSHNEFVKKFQEMPILESTQIVSLQKFFIVCFVINTLLFMLYIVVMKKLFRLKNLKNDIRKFGELKNFQAIALDSNDELGQIAREFNVAMEKLYQMKEARTLFLRNILHELKTPIMKGKIISGTYEDKAQKRQLENVFSRLETLLVEMVKVEKLTSDEWQLDKKEYRLVDVLDNAIDLLMSDTSRIKIVCMQDLPTVKVDFALFSTALKNLLDNALKHSSGDIKVEISLKKISVKSYGNELPKEKLDFTKVFNRDIEGASSGLGLGFYIINSIVKKHNFTFAYTYEEGTNSFCISYV